MHTTLTRPGKTAWIIIINAFTERRRGGREFQTPSTLVYDILPLKKMPESDARRANQSSPRFGLFVVVAVLLVLVVFCLFIFSGTPTQERSAFGDGRGSVWLTNEGSSRCDDATIVEREPSLWRVRNPVQGLSK